MLVFGIINVAIALWLNIWNRDFFNALEKRDTSALVEQLYILAVIVASAGIAVALQLHIRRRLQFNWRAWLTHVTALRWLNSGRQYQLSLLAEECDNPDGRIAEDIRISTEFAVEFAQSILQCVLQLITFLGVLWVLSGDLPITIGGVAFSLPAVPPRTRFDFTPRLAGKRDDFLWLMNYADAKKRGKLLATVTESRQMPPWKADKGDYEFKHERRLTDAQIETIKQWVAAGMPEGNPAKLPPMPKFAEGWQLGKPDLIVKMSEAFTVPADGPDIYHNFALPLNLTEDKWVRAIE